MNTLRIENKDTYRIEVNDKGEYIEFDLSDISFGAKLYDAIKQVKEIETKYTKLMQEAEQDLDKYYELEKEMFIDTRKAMDTALGENACQKIFGDRNYYEMFNDLMDELSRPREELENKSHLDMIGIKAENIHKRIKEKYNKSKEVVI